MKQREIFSRGTSLKMARQTWIDHTLEKSIVKVLMDALPLIGIHAHLILARMPCTHCGKWSGTPPAKGIPDIGGLIPAKLFRGETPLWARPLYIECKRPRGGVEGIEQQDFIERVRREGGVAFFCRGLDECCEELDRAGVKIPNTIWEPKALDDATVRAQGHVVRPPLESKGEGLGRDL
jgi:hypothetical protein